MVGVIAEEGLIVMEDRLRFLDETLCFRLFARFFRGSHSNNNRFRAIHCNYIVMSRK
jgi:hypothetical protein